MSSQALFEFSTVGGNGRGGGDERERARRTEGHMGWTNVGGDRREKNPPTSNILE